MISVIIPRWNQAAQEWCYQHGNGHRDYGNLWMWHPSSNSYEYQFSDPEIAAEFKLRFG